MLWFTILLFLSALPQYLAFPAAPPGEAAEYGGDGYDKGGHEKGGGHCKHPIKRKEWRSLSRADRLSFQKAVQCLHRLPAKNTVKAPGAVTRFDDHQAEHIVQTEDIHFVGIFLPWHRRFIQVFEESLRKECGLKIGLPYWDWTLDVKVNGGPGLLDSPMWDPETGFGGNGVYVNCTNPEDPACFPGGTGGGCITTGPYKDFEIHLGPQNNTERFNRCIVRDFRPLWAEQQFAKARIDATMSKPDYISFWQEAEGRGRAAGPTGSNSVHSGGHRGVGGMMQDPFSSPGDPIFYLHHGMMDKMWWDWQKMDLKKRTKEVGGTLHSQIRDNFGLPRKYPEGVNATLETEIGMGIMAKKVKVKDLLDIKKGALCYEYV